MINIKCSHFWFSDKEGDEQTAAVWPRKRKGTKSGQKNPRGIRYGKE